MTADAHQKLVLLKNLAQRRKGTARKLTRSRGWQEQPRDDKGRWTSSGRPKTTTPMAVRTAKAALNILGPDMVDKVVAGVVSGVGGHLLAAGADPATGAAVTAGLAVGTRAAMRSGRHAVKVFQQNKGVPLKDKLKLLGDAILSDLNDPETQKMLISTAIAPAIGSMFGHVAPGEGLTDTAAGMGGSAATVGRTTQAVHNATRARLLKSAVMRMRHSTA